MRVVAAVAPVTIIVGEAETLGDRAEDFFGMEGEGGCALFVPQMVVLVPWAVVVTAEDGAVADVAAWTLSVHMARRILPFFCASTTQNKSRITYCTCVWNEEMGIIPPPKAAS
jgi:hypothetical protein